MRSSSAPALLLAVSLALAPAAEARHKKKRAAAAESTPGEFAYYVLSLSWSPTFCEKNAEKSPEQCDGQRHYGFVVHGLWPQHEKGWPEKCSTEPLPEDVKASMLDLMPSAKLVAHEWEKHGTCSGLPPKDYFALVRKAFETVKLPKDLVKPKDVVSTDLAGIEDRFVTANPGLSREGISVQCRKFVSEVRVCLDKALKFRACGDDTQDRCEGDALFPPVR